MRDPVRVGTRVYLRRLVAEDSAPLAVASHLEEETGQHPSGRMPMSILSFEAWIASIGADEQVFAICRIEDDACLGTTSIRHIDREHGTAETGSGLNYAEDRGQGIGTEAKLLLLDHAFETLGLHALSSQVFEGNVRSARALAKQGYRLAGRLSANESGSGGTIGDTLVFDITRGDWERRRGQR